MRSHSANCNNSRHNSSQRIILINIHVVTLDYMIHCVLQMLQQGHSWNNNGLQFVDREELQLRISGLCGERLFSISDTDLASLHNKCRTNLFNIIVKSGGQVQLRNYFVWKFINQVYRHLFYNNNMLIYFRL